MAASKPERAPIHFIGLDGQTYDRTMDEGVPDNHARPTGSLYLLTKEEKDLYRKILNENATARLQSRVRLSKAFLRTMAILEMKDYIESVRVHTLRLMEREKTNLAKLCSGAVTCVEERKKRERKVVRFNLAIKELYCEINDLVILLSDRGVTVAIVDPSTFNSNKQEKVN